MTLWFGPLIELQPAHGYFHLCPACFDETIAPEMDELQSTLARLNPAAAAYLEREREGDGARPGDRAEDSADGLAEDSADGLAEDSADGLAEGSA